MKTATLVLILCWLSGWSLAQHETPALVAGQPVPIEIVCTEDAPCWTYHMEAE